MRINRNNYKKTICLSVFIICFFTANRILAQTVTDPNSTYLEFDLKKTLPTSPEAAMLGKFGDIPIGYYTGTADISIPLYTIKEGDLSIPINLSYHNSGVKVEDEATWVGLGWNLEPGGSIIKIVNGRDDGNIGDGLPFQPGYQYLFNRSITGAYSTTGQIGDGDWICNTANGASSPPQDVSIGDTTAVIGALTQGYGQPDIYQYSFPGGYSGKFYINPISKLPVLIDKKENVTFTSNTSTAWIATTLNGDKYEFNALEQSYTNTLQGYSGETWRLTKITLNNGKVITFSYYNSGNSGMTYNESYHDPYLLVPVSANDFGVVKHYDNTYSYGQTLTQIKTDDVIINFNLENRADLSPVNSVNNGTLYPKQLKSMDIVSPLTGQLLKTYNFNYSYFTSSTDPSFTYISTFTNESTLMTYSSLRLRLDSLQEEGYTGNNQPVYNPAYKFTYNTSVTLPSKSSYSRDFWGFYNGKLNTNLIPDLKYFYYSNFDNYKNVPTATLNAFSGANRTVDTALMMAGMLKRITYPTGGSTAFAYQPNDFSNYSYPDISQINATVSSISVQDQNNPTDQKTATFTLSTAQTVQFNNYIEGGPTPTAPSFYAIEPSTITLSSTVNGTTTIVKQWTVTTDMQAAYNSNDVISWLSDPVALQANVPYTISVELPDALGSQNTASAQAIVLSTFQYYAPATNPPQVSYGGGVRIASITNYDQTGVVISNKMLKYVNTDGTSSGKLMSNLDYLYFRNLTSTIYVGPPDNQYVNWVVGPIWFISSQSVIPYSNSAGGNMVGYSRVEEIETGIGNTTDGMHVYNYLNIADQTRPNSPNIPNLTNGLITEEDFLKSTGDAVKTVSYLYSDHNMVTHPTGISYTGAKIFSNFIGSDPCSTQYNLETNPNKYEIDFYPINSAWNLLNSKQTKDYFNGNVVTTTQGFVYNNIGQLVRDSIINSKGEILTTYNKFPNDADTINTLINKQLVDSSFYNNILEQHKLNNEVETSQTKISYAVINNQLVRSEIDRSFNGNPLFTDATFNQYGPNKNIQQVSEHGIVPSALIWDYTNSYVIAEVKNANIADIAYSSFEPNQAGNWAVNPSAIANPVGITGNHSCTLGGGTISKSGLNASKTYIVSYWTNTGTPLTIAGTVTGYPKAGVTLNGWTYYEYLITGQTTITLSGGGTIDELRLYPLGTQMTSYTYNPPIGITSMINAKSQINYYEYDPFLRLLNIKDQYGNIVKSYTYHYQGQ
ncbi:hypothetical protein HDF24_07465 [Mucilaginibacter sp. X4EP1]|uniref:hypothetical protein n=1 Tax=Mucilaginibacter sp. X4EP1 TaxID=2723092 RepID=UPI0021695A8B|nr:hypothetical protein [Mucilaginibacter sp. X4EP1]MCS3814152.1 hypothetical protein [Mucilaginibacter sp. X4EP1]